MRHIRTKQEEKEESSKKKTLIGDNDSDSEEDAPKVHEPIWLIMTTKKHVVDKNRLKPGKISIPHSLNTSASLSVCLITADPQRGVKDIVADETFPPELRNRITRIIGYTKLKERYKSFESRRQLLAEHDVFLADDRIIMRLVKTLGKTFYKSSKRPIPVRIERIEKVDGKRVKKDGKKPPKSERQAQFASAQVLAKEVEKALSCAPVHLAPATTTAVRVGTSKFTPEQLLDNIKAVVQGLTDKYITKGWRNVKAIHIKGPNTAALPIWLADELWVDEGDILDNPPETEEKDKKNEKKRKSSETTSTPAAKKTKTSKKTADDEVDVKETLKKRKAKALKASA